MKFSTSLIKTTKHISKEETSKNAQLLLRAGFVDKLMAGVFSYLPLGYCVLQKTADLVRKHINATGGIELLMPALHSKVNYEATQRWDSMDVLMRFKTHWTQTEYALGATHEEIVTPLMKRFIRSYNDLPRAVYQIQTKFRDEKRAKSGLLRGREFMMKDLYSFHADPEDLDTYYNIVKNAYADIFAELGIGERTYFTYASGGDFSKYSHEFQTVCDTGEDTIYICDACHVAVNKEIIEEESSCPECGTTHLREEKAIEVGNIFKLQRRFSDAFHVSYMDKEGLERPVMMGCYGIGIGRLMGVVAEVLSDEKGLVWPQTIAPFQVHMIGLQLEDAAVAERADKLYQELVHAGIDVLYDDRKTVGTGARFMDADLIGCPFQLVLSKSAMEKGEVEIVERSKGHKTFATIEDAVPMLQRMMKGL